MTYLKIFYRYWMAFAHFLGKINSTIILSIIYIVVIGLVSIIRRLIILFSRKQNNKSTYWVDSDDVEENLISASYQF